MPVATRTRPLLLRQRPRRRRGFEPFFFGGSAQLGAAVPRRRSMPTPSAVFAVGWVRVMSDCQRVLLLSDCVDMS